MSPAIALKNFGYAPDPKKRSDQKPDLEFEEKLLPFLATQASGDVDLRAHATDTNQFSLPSCVGNATADSVEILSSVQGYPKVELSRMFVWTLARFLMAEDGHKANTGTYIRNAFQALNKFGICLEKYWPYDSSKWDRLPSLKAMRKATGRKIKGYYRITGSGDGRCDQILKALRAEHPVVFGTNLGSEWSRYRGDTTLDIPDDNRGGHAMVVVGYDSQKGFIVKNSWGCYDDETEVLTRRGWVLFKNVKGNDVFATLNPASHALEYQSAEHYHEYPFEGDLLHFQSQGVDLRVTPNHRMYTSSYHKRGRTNWDIRRADETEGRICFKKDAVNTTSDVRSFEVAGKIVEADAWLAFMGYYLSEGSATLRNVERHRSRVRKYTRSTTDQAIRDGTTGQFLTKQGENETAQYLSNENYTETYRATCLSQVVGESANSIRQTLRRIPFHFTESGPSYREGRQPLVSWTCAQKGLFDAMYPLGKALGKRIPRPLLNLSQRQSRILLEALMLGDGTTVQGKFVYYTSSEGLAGDVQELALKCGWAADITKIDRSDKGYALEYQVGIKRKRRTPVSRHSPTKEPYKGMVYCVTVPNGLVYVRRRGQATWCGNSNWGDHGYCYLSPEYMGWRNTRDIWVPTMGHNFK